MQKSVLGPGVLAGVQWRGAYLRVDAFAGVCADHLAQIPELARLVLAIGNDIAPIALAINVRHTFRMTQEHACRSHRSKRSSIPHLHCRVV